MVFTLLILYIVLQLTNMDIFLPHQKKDRITHLMRNTLYDSNVSVYLLTLTYIVEVLGPNYS